jgi:hypothetical protein
MKDTFYNSKIKKYFKIIDEIDNAFNVYVFSKEKEQKHALLSEDEFLRRCFPVSKSPSNNLLNSINFDYSISIDIKDKLDDIISKPNSLISYDNINGDEIAMSCSRINADTIEYDIKSNIQFKDLNSFKEYISNNQILDIKEIDNVSKLKQHISLDNITKKRAKNKQRA